MANKRNLSALELAILENSLKTGETLESLAARAQIDPDQLQSVFRQKGVALPTSRATATLTEAERNIYLDTLTSSINAADLARREGFSNEAMLNRLRETGLYIPLTQDHASAYNEAVDLGLTADQAAERYGTTVSDVNTILGAAGLALGAGAKKLPLGAGAKKLPKPGELNIGGPRNDMPQMPSYGMSSGASNPANILGAIPQIPSLRMVRRSAQRQNDPNWQGTTDTILTSGRGVSGEANTRTRTLLGS